MRIPESKIEEIRSSSNILDVVSGYVQLRKRGKNYIGLCPFHQEKTPSFTVSEEKQIFHCFGCAAGGNVFKFLMDFKNISFVEAVQEVADQYGIKISYEQEASNEEQAAQEILYDINVLAARYFSNNLLQSEDGETGRQYFKKRNIKIQTQKNFGLGYARPEWEDLLLYLKENKIAPGKALELGLIDKRDDGTYYDKFRGRIIFPIFSPNGRVIAFGGRIMDPDAKAAKYLNSPESMVYSKRRSLYGLYQSKEEIRKLNKVILVEGYMDLLSLFQHGVKNVVASSGTSLTEEQVQLLSRFTRNIIVLFDADTAGQKAASRSIEILLKQDFDVRVVSLPDNEDPDSYINKYSKEEFEDLINRAKNFLEYQTEQFDKAGMFGDPAKLTEAIRELVKTAALVSDDLKRNLLIKSIAKRFNLREKLIESELDRYFKEMKEREVRSVDFRSKVPLKNNSLADISKLDINKILLPMEKEIIQLMFEGSKEVLQIIKESISPDDFSNRAFQELSTMVLESFEDGIVLPAALIDRIDDEKIKNYILSVSFDHEPISKKWDELTHSGKIEINFVQYTRDLIKNFKLRKIDEQIKSNNAIMSSVSNENQILELMKMNSDLQKEKKMILSSNGNST